MEINSHRRQNTKVAAAEIFPIFSLNTPSKIILAISYMFWWCLCHTVDTNQFQESLIFTNHNYIYIQIDECNHERRTSFFSWVFHGHFWPRWVKNRKNISQAIFHGQRKCWDFSQRMHLTKKKSWEGKVNVRNPAKISCENADRNPEREKLM